MSLTKTFLNTEKASIFGTMISFFVPIKKTSRRVKKKNTRKVFNYKLGLTEIKILQLLKFKKLASKDNILKNQKFEFIISSNDLKIENFIKISLD